MKSNIVEFNFLLEVCKISISPNKNGRSLNIYPPKNINWETVLKLANSHRVRPLLFLGLRKCKNQAIFPATLMERLKTLNFQITTRNLIQTKELIKLFQLFKKNDINVIPYKGVILAKEAYQNLGAREFSDLDLLIDQKDFKKVKQILLEQNYQWMSITRDNLMAKYFSINCEHSFHYYERNRRQYAIDLHWLISIKYHQLAIDFEMVKPMVYSSENTEFSLPTLGPEGLLLTTCIHHFGKDQSHCLRNICDIASILLREDLEINWKLLMTTAQRWKVRNILALGIGVTCTLLSIKAPENFQPLLQSRKLKNHINKHIKTLQMDKHNFNGSIKTFINLLELHLSLREHFSTKIKIVYYVLCFLIAPTIKNLNENPNANYWYLLIKKPFRLGRKYVLSWKTEK